MTSVSVLSIYQVYGCYRASIPANLKFSLKNYQVIKFVLVVADFPSTMGHPMLSTGAHYQESQTKTITACKLRFQRTHDAQSIKLSYQL